MLHKYYLILCAAIVLQGCTATSPLARFEECARLSVMPEKFESVQNSTAQVDAAISLKAPGLRGKAEGIVRHANGGQYLIELYGRGELFLKVYFTATQTVLWPAAGMPAFFEPDSTPTLNFAVHSRLPKWRLDDVLPVPMARDSVTASDWRIARRGPVQRIDRDGCVPLIKQYLREGNDPQFPYRKVVLSTETGSSSLVWSLRDARHE
ncbi:MAG: hypothetical protein IPG71_11325 [bacterium]|nr:hypothetical protein [bacterium]